MTEFKYFRHAITGKVGYYPEDFGDLFYDTFIEVDSNAADCVDCWLKPEEDEDHLVETGFIDDDFVDDVDDDDFVVAFDDDFPEDVALSDENKDNK